MDDTNNQNAEKSTVDSSSTGTYFTNKKKKVSIAKFAKENFLALQTSSFNLFIVVVIAMVIMFVSASIVFFSTVKGEEQVMVPNVVGKQLTTALLEMQTKELYPKIQLRYTNSDDDAGTILAQSPEPGSIRKAGARVNLTVSEGAIANEVENFVGMNYKDVKEKIDTMFKKTSRPMLSLGEPSFKTDNSAAGTILAQTPEPGTKVSTPTAIRLIVSSGPEETTTSIPNLVGKNVAEILSELKNSRIVFDFTKSIATDEANAGKVVKQAQTAGTVKNYSRISCEFAVPSVQNGDNITDLFTAQLAEFPLPVSVKLEAIKTDGKSVEIAVINHTGGNVTIPYSAPRDSELVLSVAGKVVARQKAD